MWSIRHLSSRLDSSGTSGTLFYWELLTKLECFFLVIFYDNKYIFIMITILICSQLYHVSSKLDLNPDIEEHLNFFIGNS